MKFAIALCCLLLAAPAFAGEGTSPTTCTSCTDIESALLITPAWQLEAGSTLGLLNGEFTYEFCAVAGEVYEFTFCREGGGADYDTDLSIWALDGGRCATASEACNDDTCGLQSELVWAAGAAGQYVLRVAGFGSSEGNYELAYRGAPCATPVDNATWGLIKAIYE